jgi:hypothetical protein
MWLRIYKGWLPQGRTRIWLAREGGVVTVGQSSYHRVLYGPSSSGRMELWWWATPFTHTPQTHNKALFTAANTRRFLNFLTASRHVRFAAAGASLAESRARVLPMNQSSDGLQS